METIKNTTVNEEYSYYVHESGIKVYLFNKKGYSASYAVFGTAYGSVDTCFSKNGGEKISVPEGIAHFLEHKLFESEKQDAFQLFAKTGASANAYTSFDRTCYLFSCGDRLEENLQILLNFVQNPYFTAETVQKEQGIIGQEIDMYLDSPSWRVMFNLLKALYKNNPVSIEIAGTKNSIAQIDKDLLYSCYNTFYNPNNMFICVVGDFNKEEIKAIIDGGIKNTEKAEINRYLDKEPDFPVKKYTEENMVVSKPLYHLGFKDETLNGYPTGKKQLCMELLLDIAFGKSSPFYKDQIFKGNITSPFEFEYFCTRGAAAVLIGGEADNPELMQQEILNELERLRKDGIDQELFSAAVNSRYCDEVLSFDEVEDIGAMLVDCAVTGGTLFDDIELLNNLKKSDVEDCLINLTAEYSALSVVKEKAE